jgi:hypothetical protein
MTPTLLTITWILLAIWGLGMFAMMARLWYFQIVLLNNMAPGRTPFEQRGFFDSSRYNPIGQEAHRKMLRFYWKTIACGLGGLISIAIIASLLSYISSPS